GGCSRRAHDDGEVGGKATAVVADHEPDDQAQEREARCEGEDTAASAGEERERDRGVGPVLHYGSLLQREGELGARPGLDGHLMHLLQAGPLVGWDVVTDELGEFWSSLVHPRSSSPSSRSAIRARPLRVLVFTVPRGMPRKSATSLCERPPQYASSSTDRSVS